MKVQIFDRRGMTLAELMIATMIMSITFVGILSTFLYCLSLGELSEHKATALASAKTKMEAIRNTPFEDLVATYDHVTFSVPADLNGSGISYIDDSANPNLIRIKVSVCWREKNGRMIGEDSNLNGVLNGGEDVNGNSEIDSPVQLETLISNPDL